MNKTRTGSIVSNKITGDLFKVTKVTDTAVTLVPVNLVATDVPFGPNEYQEYGDPVTYTPVQMVCFRTIELADPAIPNYFVNSEGILMDRVTENPVTEQGTLQFIKVLQAAAGRVLLLAKGETEDTQKLIQYYPEDDLFNTVAQMRPVQEISSLDDDNLVLNTASVKEMTVKDQETGEEKTVLTENPNGQLYFIHNAMLIKSINANGIYGPLGKVKKLVHTQHEGSQLFIQLESPYNYTEEGYLKERDDGKLQLTILMLNGEDMKIYYTKLVSGLKTIIPSRNSDPRCLPEFLIKEAGQMTLTRVNESGKSYKIENPEILTVLGEYDFVVECMTDYVKKTWSITFANKNLDTKTVTSTLSNDRGVVVTID